MKARLYTYANSGITRSLQTPLHDLPHVQKLTSKHFSRNTRMFRTMFRMVALCDNWGACGCRSCLGRYAGQFRNRAAWLRVVRGGEIKPGSFQDAQLRTYGCFKIAYRVAVVSPSPPEPQPLLGFPSSTGGL